MSKVVGRFMVAVGAIIENTKTVKILLLYRNSKADFSGGIWEDITGRMQQFEEPKDTLRREVKEEAGLDIKILKPIETFHLFRGEKTADKELVGIIFWCQTVQEEVKLSGEHTDYKWLKPKEALTLAEHPGVKRDIQAFIREKDRRTSL